MATNGNIDNSPIIKQQLILRRNKTMTQVYSDPTTENDRRIRQ
tara:strand:+ start:325 stop:453 length:129 start_codon:yes stop_codon:yes gene_type:complete